MFPNPPPSIHLQENFDYRGKVVELAGPGEFSWREVVDLVLDTSHRSEETNVRGMEPFEAKLWGMGLEMLPNPMFTADEVPLCVCTGGGGRGSLQGLAAMYTFFFL